MPAPGGSLEHKDAEPSRLCLFRASNDAEIRQYAELFVRLTRRYKYMQVMLSESWSRLLSFLKGSSEDDRRKLAVCTGHLMSEGIIAPNVLQKLAESEHLVKEGIALAFVTEMLRTWLARSNIDAVASALRKASMQKCLISFFPSNSRTNEALEQHFNAAGLEQVVHYWRRIATSTVKADLKNQMTEMLSSQASPEELVSLLRESTDKGDLTEADAVVLAWDALMNAVEWSKKSELVADPALRHLNAYVKLLSAFTHTMKCEMALLLRIQAYCYENMNFTKVRSGGCGGVRRAHRCTGMADALAAAADFPSHRAAHVQ